MICHVIRNFTSLGINYKIGQTYEGQLVAMLSELGLIRVEGAADNKSTDVVTQAASVEAPKRGRGRPKKTV